MGKMELVCCLKTGHEPLFIDENRKYESCEVVGVGYVAGMGWQELTALTIVASTASIFVWNRLKRRKLEFAKHGPCGCASHSNPPQHSIIYTSRKGEPAKILVKMR